MVEYYFKGVGLFSVGFFNKNISDWIYQYSTKDYTYNGVSGYEMQQLRNGEKATCKFCRVNFLNKVLEQLYIHGSSIHPQAHQRTELKEEIMFHL